jgi:hypothetical protein
MQLLVLGDQLLSLGKDGQLLVWKIGEYDSPQVSTPAHSLAGPACCTRIYSQAASAKQTRSAAAYTD